MTLPRCHLCDCPSSLMRFKIGDAAFRQCTGCTLIYLWPHPTEFASTYHKDYYHERSIVTATPLNRFLHNRYLDQLESVLPASHRQLLDVGCGTGYFMDMARARGWQVEGVDISPQAVQHARTHYQLKVHLGEIAQLPPHPYDVITLWDVVEHLPHPLEVLSHARWLLKPGGVLALTTPNVRGISTRLAGRHSCIFDPQEHLYFFSPRTLRHLLTKAGFRMLGCTTQTIYLRNIAALFRASPTQHPQQGRKHYHSLYQTMQGKAWLYGIRLVNGVLRLFALGDQMVAFARKA